MNRRTCLTVLLALAASFVMLRGARAQEADTERLRAEFLTAYQARDWPTAIERGRALCAALPEDPAVAYNLACVYALSAEPQTALKWLARSVELGFEDGALLRDDPDLASLRGTPGYAAVVRDLEGRAGRASREFEALLAASEPLIWVPPDHDLAQPATVIVALHGYGVDASDIAAGWQAAAAHIGAVVVAPRTVRRAEGTKGFTWGSVDEAERIVLRALELAEKKLAVDPQRIVLTGFSQGAYMSLNIAARHPERFRGVLPVAAFYRPEDAPFAAAAEGRTPRFYLMVGDQDGALEGNRQAARDLEARGYPVKLVVFEGLGHAFPPDPEVELHAALHYVLD